MASRALDLFPTRPEIRAEVRTIKKQVARLEKEPLPALAALHAGFLEDIVQNNRFLRRIVDRKTTVARSGYVPPPRVRFEELRPFVMKTYAVRIDRHPSAGDPFPRLFDPKTRRAAMLQRLLQESRPVRGAFEKVAGAKVVVDQRTDGTVTMCETSALTSDGGQPPPRPSGQPETLYDLFGQLNQQILQEANEVYQKQNPNPMGDGVLSSSLSAYGPDPSVEAVDVAVFRLDTDRLEEMYSLVNNMNKAHDNNANRAVENMRA